MTVHTCNISQIRPLTNNILQVFLELPKKTDYEAGQYLTIQINKQSYPFSIANAPLGTKQLELHIRHTPSSPNSQFLVEYIKKRGKLDILLPFGSCTVSQVAQAQKLIFIASGTGFAPIKAMIEQLLANGDERAMHIFWRAREHQDLYLDSLLLNWQAHVPNFFYTPYLKENTQTYTLAKMVENHCRPWFSQSAIILAGPFDKVLELKDNFLAMGLKKTQLFSDAFNL